MRMDEGKHLHELLEDFDTAMLVTRTHDGHLHARPMAVAELRADADVYFVTRVDSPKVAEIYADADVLVTFQSARQYAALYGRVNVVQDRAVIDRLWKETWAAWFPRGKSDPSIALLRFDAQRGEFWDNSGLQGLRYVFEATKAYARGERPKVDPEQHARVRLS
jgi:general stress protein 26